MARTKEEREQRRLAAKERATQRKADKAGAKKSSGESDDEENAPKKLSAHDITLKLQQNTEHNTKLPCLSLPIDALAKIVRYLPSREFGALSLTCLGYNQILGGCRVHHISSRLMRREDEECKQSTCGSMCLVGGLQLCSGRREAQVSSGGKSIPYS